MRTRRRNVIADSRTITTRSKNEVKNSVSIPVDLIIEILLRLPAKSIATCRCVSKLWGSIIRRQSFTELFLTKSLHCPRFLFSCIKDGNTFFFSSPQLQNLAENSSATSLMNFSFSSQIRRSVHGLMCLTHELKKTKETVIVICNPSTGQSLNLPKPKERSDLMSFLMYEPIKKQFKVLSPYDGDEHQVLTLETGELSWRRIECSIPYFPIEMSEICINGVLYFQAINLSSEKYMIVCFDVSSEKFSYITDMEEFNEAAQQYATVTPMNYNGKLALFVYKPRQSINLLILQDAEQRIWSKHAYVVPAWLDDIFETVSLDFLGVTPTNEIMLAQRYVTVPFYVFYFNIETKTIIRVAIHGLAAFRNQLVFTVFDYVENVKLI